MPDYCVNRNPQLTGENEVHNLDVYCPRPPATHNQLQLGYFSSCFEALKKAKEYYSNVDGCAYCAPECHKR